MEIKNFEEFIKPTLKAGQKFVGYEAKNLLSAGENYGSVMLEIQVKILNEEGDDETIYCVGKTCPPSQLLWEIFNTKVTFKKEIAVYNIIVPALNEFGKEKGIDNLLNFFAKSLGARISLDPESDVVDKDAILVLENLKMQGYSIGDRFNGFDMECSKLLLRDLATMHAAVIAYRLEKPVNFITKMLPYLNKDQLFYIKGDIVDNFIKNLHDSVSRNPQCIPHLSKIDKAIREMKKFVLNPPKGKDQFRTLIHNDFWVNNTMLKYENGKAVSNKMVDFQLIEHSSLAHDVIFFVYTSVTLSVLENHIDELFKFYYNTFVEILVKLNCDVSVYSFESMMEEFANMARDVQFSHILFMLSPIFTLKGKSKDLSEMKLSDVFTDENTLHSNYFKTMEFVLLDFVKRGWI